MQVSSITKGFLRAILPAAGDGATSEMRNAYCCGTRAPMSRRLRVVVNLDMELLSAGAWPGLWH